ncbi:hypothetical protein PUR23_01055 [Methylorubrum populi]|uniref:hypothetical protein n=1 Tax=Methylorubrum populi TaxID=223967 RepID=UPI0031F916DB
MMKFVCKALRCDPDRLAFWLSVGGELVLSDGIYRLERDAPAGDRRRPSPAPVPEDLALDAIRAGAPVWRDGDLFGATLTWGRP